jgi:hypothetical protein
VTITANPTTVTCPTWCRRIHDEGPLDSVIHESERAEIFSMPHPCGPSKPVRVSLGQDDDGRVFVLLGEDELAPVDAEHLIAVLTATVNQAYATLADLEQVAR